MVHRWKIHLFYRDLHAIRFSQKQSWSPRHGMPVVYIRWAVSHPGTVGQSGMEDTVMTCAAFWRAMAAWRVQRSHELQDQETYTIRHTAESVHPWISWPVTMDLLYMICILIIWNTTRKTAGEIQTAITMETAGTVEQKEQQTIRKSRDCADAW